MGMRRGRKRERRRGRRRGSGGEGGGGGGGMRERGTAIEEVAKHLDLGIWKALCLRH